MRYISTRGNIEAQTASQAVSLGMVPAGGLFVPQEIPTGNWRGFSGLKYDELALAIMRLFSAICPTGPEEAVKVYRDGEFDTVNPRRGKWPAAAVVLKIMGIGPTAALRIWLSRCCRICSLPV
jgi:threonine synthase